jgi:hypothetical protein
MHYWCDECEDESRHQVDIDALYLALQGSPIEFKSTASFYLGPGASECVEDVVYRDEDEPTMSRGSTEVMGDM